MQVSLSPHAQARLRPLSLNQVELTRGFWAARQQINRTVSLLHGQRQLEAAGNFNNLRLAAGRGVGQYRGYVFQDSDVYKWLEAVALELGRGPDPQLAGMADDTIALLTAAQQPDGYLNSHFQVVKPAERWTDLDHAHEMYCGGHLIEAAIAHHRATGQDALLNIARRFADHIDAAFGPGKRAGACGHPEIELALVELYRETDEVRYLNLAKFFIDQRGQNRMRGYGSFGPAYHQDRVPVRRASIVEGHAVRQLYLTSGVADLYLETGEPALLEALQRQWHDMTAHKMYLTGGVGSRGHGEAFGEPYELPSREAYCETCAAIASSMWNWRMLLITGEPRFADVLERTLYNGFLSGLALDGTHFFYENPLQSEGAHLRQEWYACACCPPNVMRTIALIGHYLATMDSGGAQIHQYASARLHTRQAALSIDTDYPWEGRIVIGVEQSAADPWTLSLRIPAWCQGAEVHINDARPLAVAGGTYAAVERYWRAGDTVTLTLPMPPRLTAPHPRVDALRGCLAIERGPLVYCLEAADHEPGLNLADVRLQPEAPLQTHWRADLLGGMTVIEAQGAVADVRRWSDSLYQPAAAGAAAGRAIKLTAIPNYAWAQRTPGQMRVWIPSAA
jgi:hypothetical protein